MPDLDIKDLLEHSVNWDETTGSGIAWHQEFTSNDMGLCNVLDILTDRPYSYNLIPKSVIVKKQARQTEKVIVEIAEADRIKGFYYLVLNGEVKCLLGDLFEIKKELLDILREHSIHFEVV